jgi:hypothetical protein
MYTRCKRRGRIVFGIFLEDALCEKAKRVLIINTLSTSFMYWNTFQIEVERALHIFETFQLH